MTAPTPPTAGRAVSAAPPFLPRLDPDFPAGTRAPRWSALGGDELVKFAGHVTLPEDAVVCSCNSVTRGALEQAHRDGADDVDAIASATRATTGCGSCRATVCGLLEVFAGQEVPA